MTIEPCNRCQTESRKIRIKGYCVWCYAVLNERPADAQRKYGLVVDTPDLDEIGLEKESYGYRCSVCEDIVDPDDLDEHRNNHSDTMVTFTHEKLE